MRRADDELRKMVLDELDRKSLLDASALDASVEDGVVTLVGTVSSLAEKLTAQSAIESLDPVHDLVSRIDVKRSLDAGPSDEDFEVSLQTCSRGTHSFPNRMSASTSWTDG